MTESVPMQTDCKCYDSRCKCPKTLNKNIAKAAHDEYALHFNQSFERLHERGGFSMGEVVMLLYDALMREKGQTDRQERMYVSGGKAFP